MTSMELLFSLPFPTNFLVLIISYRVPDICVILNASCTGFSVVYLTVDGESYL